MAVVGIVFVEGWSLSICSGAPCGSHPEPSIQGATAQVDAFSPTPCQTTPTVATCSVFLSGGDRGTITLNVSGSGGGKGGPQVEFLVYSSAASYVSFTSIPSCAHASAPSHEDSGCQVSARPSQSFVFSFVVAANYGDATARWPDSISVVMWMNCCSS
jgi:hypothetical protein